MRRLLTILCGIIIAAGTHAQTCVGTFTFKLFNPKTKKPITEKLDKSIVYVFTKEESEFYDDVSTVIPLDSIFKKKQGYTVRKNEKGYNFFPNNDPSTITFPNLCGLYLVHMDLYGKNDTMGLNFYNIPAHQSFQIDTVMFRGGGYYLDLKASTGLSEFEFVDNKGYFEIPASAIEPGPPPHIGK